MISLLASSILLILFFHPALLIVKRLNIDNNQWEKVVSWFLLSSTIIPLYIFYLNHFGGIPLNQKNIYLSLLALNIILFLIFKLFPTKVEKRPIETLSSKEKYIYIFSSIIIILYFNFPYIVNHQPILGGDTPNYLSNISLLIKNQFPSLVFDRSIVYFFPAILSVITNISVELILKLYIASYELIFTLISLSLAKKYISSQILIYFVVALIFSPATLILSKYVIAFFVSFTILYYIISKLLSSGFNKNLFLPILWGALFNLHGVVAFSSLIIIPPLLLYQSIKNKIHSNKYILWIILFILTSQPLIATQWGRINAGVIQPITTSLNLEKIEKSNNQPIEKKADINQILETKEERWVDEFTSNKSKSLKEFPLIKDSFTSSFFIPTLIFAILGIILSLSNPKARKNILPILIVTFILFLLTQQEYLGMVWFPMRFVFAMGPLIYLLAFFYLDKLFERLKKPVVACLIGFIAITLPTTITGVKEISTLSANIKIAEYNFIKSLNTFTKDGDAIFVGAATHYWIQALVPQSIVYPSNFKAICNYDLAGKGISKEKQEVGRAFSTSVTLGQSIQIFEKYSQENPYFIYLDTINYHCINGELFPASEYTILDQKDGYIFLKHE